MDTYYKEVYEKLNELDKLFDKASKWTKRAYARSESGKVVNCASKDAICWCLTGGILKVCNGSFEYLPIVNLITRQIMPNIPAFNDAPTTSFKDIKKVIKGAKQECLEYIKNG